jgi:hypothetical protein
MKSIRLAVITLLGFCAAASAQINMPNPQDPGGSMMTAVRIVAANDIMIDRFISRWLRRHYPGWDAQPHDIQEMGPERYAVVYITHPDHSGRRVYFRIVNSTLEPDDSDSTFPL